MNKQDLPYTLVVPSIYGQVMVNRYDTNQTNALIKTGEALDADEIRSLQAIIQMLPAGQVFLDVGANFGLYSLAIAKTLLATGGVVHAFEAQRVLFNMVCGSVALNSVENLFVHHLAISDREGSIPIPKYDYRIVTSFGSVEFGEQQQEPLTQERQSSTEHVRTIALDSLQLPRVDMIKIDIEGMEQYALEGAKAILATHRPIVLIEWMKSDKEAIIRFFVERDYAVYDGGGNFLCMPNHKEPQIDIVGTTRLA